MTPHAIVGTAGHIDHGKTALIKALTGQDTDRLKEEKERGISIDLGFAHLDLDDGRRVGIVDVPGHERFIRNMLAGAHGIDLALLVVAADDGVMPQTEEHVDILHLLGVRSGVVALTKTDLVTPARVEAVREEVEILLAGTTIEGAPILAVSSVTGSGVSGLRRAIDERLRSYVRPQRPGLFRLPIDRSFVLHGHGLVITGTAISGIVREGDVVRILPSGASVRVRSVHVHGQPVGEASAGQRVALNLAGAERDDITRGHVACSPILDRGADRIDARVELRRGGRHAIPSHGPIRLFIGTAESTGKLVTLDHRSQLAPGDSAFAQIVLPEPVPAWRGDRFVLRDAASQRTIGGGVVVHPFAARHRRNDSAVLAALATIHEPDDDAAVIEAIVALERSFAMSLAFLLQAAHLSPERLLEIVRDHPRLVALPTLALAEAVTTSSKWERLRAAVTDTLAQFHQGSPLAPGVEMESMRTQVAPELTAKTFRDVVDRLGAEGALIREESLVRLPGHRVALGGAQRALAERAESLLVEAGFTPPDLKQLESTLSAPRGRLGEVLQQLEREGRVFRVAPDLYYAAPVLERARALLREGVAVQGEITAATFRDLIQASRKFSIALLDYFDRTGFTLRVGDARKLRR
jgi:selenocysteine-specific elongation factor